MNDTPDSNHRPNNANNRSRRWRLWSSAACAVVGLSLVVVGRGVAQEKGADPRDGGRERQAERPVEREDGVPRVWIYKDVPGPRQEDTRSDAERYFNPFLFFPESVASRIVVDAQKPSSRLDPGAQGTCVEIVLPLEGANKFAGVMWIPGDSVGDRPPFNVAEKLLVGFNRPVFLKFRARTAHDERANVRFEACGFSSGEVVDGIKPAQTPKPDLTDLTERWQTVTIDLTKKAAGLDSVACPLKVIARSNENPRRDSVTVYVDDIRYEVGPPPQKEGK